MNAADDQPGTQPAESTAGAIYESTDITWRVSPQRLPSTTITLAFAASDRKLIARAGPNYLWFDVQPDAESLVVTEPVSRTDVPTSPAVRDAEEWLASFLRRRPLVTLGPNRLVLTGASAEITLSAVDARPPTMRPAQIPDFRNPLDIQNAPLRTRDDRGGPF